MKKILTIILDGFGYRESENGNAIKLANLNTFPKLWEEYPHSLLSASEEAVGLKEGQFGNSEIGHTTIGAGRLIKQKDAMIDDLFIDIDNNEEFKNLIDYLQENEKSIHLFGLFSEGFVHSNINHFYKLYDSLIRNGISKIYFHLITDGRDTDQHAAINYINDLQNKLNETNKGKIVSVCGRYYAMDRDNNWDRTKKYYDLITKGVGLKTTDLINTIKNYYEKDITDEFLPPIINNNHIIENGDVVFWLNYRDDRAKQIVSSLNNEKFAEFSRTYLDKIKVYTFFEIDKNIKTNTFLGKYVVQNPLGIYLSSLGLTQARIAETEKYAHVTFFFDGANEGKIEKCDKFLIPSPKVATYDLEPQMSAVAVTKKVITCMEKDYDFILVNYANPDMVGHTGNLEATIKAVLAVDVCLAKLVEVAEENFYKIIILADHGNADIMIDDNGNKVTTHTISKVPFIILDKNVELKPTGDLTMVAPTILSYMDIAKPKEMAETPTLFK